MTSRDNNCWVEELQSKRESAIAELRVVLVRNLRRALSGRNVDESFLEDVAQDSLIRILDRLDQFEGRSQFLTWATSVAIRVGFDQLRRSRWKDISLDDVIGDADMSTVQVVDRGARPNEDLDRSALIQSMYEVIQNDLTDRQRSALLAEIKGMPQDEIARHLGSNRNAIYKLTHDARRKLRRGLESAGYSAEDLVAIAN